MGDIDWKEILNFSQEELLQTDKEKLCESLSWMDVDDIELNFSDLKTLFRLSQDILKYKSEQVKNLLGQLQSCQRKSKRKIKDRHPESPTKHHESLQKIIANQDEEIKANKEILEQLYNDIAELEGKKNKLEANKEFEKESESSRDPLSEMNALVDLENELFMKNKHIRKLLSDLKLVEDENSTLKEKITVLKDKLTEATEIINNLTDQLLRLKNESMQLKELTGKLEQEKIELSVNAEALRKQLFEKESNTGNIYEEILAKVKHWKTIAKSKKTEVQTLLIENNKLKEALQNSGNTVSPKKPQLTEQEVKIKELQVKLSDAAKEIDESANLIVALKDENKHFKSVIEELRDHSISDVKNQSDEGKERIIIGKLKKKVKTLTFSLQAAEEIITDREKELTDIVSQLQQLQSDEGIDALIQGLKHKSRLLKVRNEGIKSLVQDVNTLNLQMEELQLENELLRQKYNLAPDEIIPTAEIKNKYKDIEKNNKQMITEIKKLDYQVINLEVENRNLRSHVKELSKILKDIGYSENIAKDIIEEKETHMLTPEYGLSESLTNKDCVEESYILVKKKNNLNDDEIKTLLEENEGLRKGLQEILEYLKDNSTSSSGILALQCPSLEKLLQSMEARHTCGWFAPHMTTVMELKSAQGGKDALLAALHEARKDTYNVMNHLTQEMKRSSDLQNQLKDMEYQNKLKDEKLLKLSKIEICEFGSWISESEVENIDFNDKMQIEEYLSKVHNLHEMHLKNGLQYFYNKFKWLFDKLTSITVKAVDDKNKWCLEKENYKAEIENLKSQIDDDESSDKSPGLLSNLSITAIHKKCTYLEESYKYIRTLNENMKNEIMEHKKESLLAAADYECQIQRLILAVANLTEKLRSSIPIAYFWKTNQALNEVTFKYRCMVENSISKEDQSLDLMKCFEVDKGMIISILESRLQQNTECQLTVEKIKNIIEDIGRVIFQKQLENLRSEINALTKKMKTVEENNKALQDNQCKLIDEALASVTNKEFEFLKEQVNKLSEDNMALKKQCTHVSGQLELALSQLQDWQNRQLSYDMEINMLRHQILDLQSVGDSKAIIARLSSEILVAHLQASESHQKTQNLSIALNKEKERRIETENMLESRQKIFDIYTFRYENKFKYMYEIMQILRQQYHGSIPLASVENYLNTLEDLKRKTHVLDEKLVEVENLRSNLMAKHSVYDQILEVTKNMCSVDGNTCQHQLKCKMMESTYAREMEYIKNKLEATEQSRKDLIQQCDHLERSIILLNQAFLNSSNSLIKTSTLKIKDNALNIEVEDVQSDDEKPSRNSATINLPKPQILTQELIQKPNVALFPIVNVSTDTLIGSPIKTQPNVQIKFAHVQIQTVSIDKQINNQLVQTDVDEEVKELRSSYNILQKEYDKVNKEIEEAVILLEQKSKEAGILGTENTSLQTRIKELRTSYNQKHNVIESLQGTIESMKIEIAHLRSKEFAIKLNRENFNENNISLLAALKQLETERNTIADEYKELLNNERDEYSKSLKNLNIKILELQSKLDRKGSDDNASNTEAFKETISKYTMKIAELEDKCFKLQSEVEEYKSELKIYQSEVDRWKDLASERLSKMEQLSSQLEERHSHEVESYKAENKHWLSQLNETQREHVELRSRLIEQKAVYIKQLSEKDTHIEQLRTVIHNLKTQVMNMQTMLAANDPSFDLSAIVEVDESSDALSPQGSDRLELKFDSNHDLCDSQDDILKISGSSTTVWQEPFIERLRRDKQLTGKQNAILRRQIKALAARERRARLDAQNLKNQLFRISTTGNKVVTAETAALHSKIATLQAQLMNIRRDSQSSVALWDKWKRAQQASERWQARYEDKCQEVKKLESSLNLAKSAITRLEREKRVLMSRITEIKSESQSTLEKQEAEPSEKVHKVPKERNCSEPPVSMQALLERIKSQQRRIVALEAAEKGNEHLVSEYEKSLAEVTSLKGQVLKLESTLLESQIRSPLKTNKNTQPEIDYWKSYCEMLKEENVQLTLKLNSLETAPTSGHQQKISDLEQTVLTLRGLVNKLQAEQKSYGGQKKIDSRPSSSRATSEKSLSQLESYRIEIANLKSSLQDKDLLLERSKQMLKIAAEREDELLRENVLLRRRIDMLSEKNGGFLSA